MKLRQKFVKHFVILGICLTILEILSSNRNDRKKTQNSYSTISNVQNVLGFQDNNVQTINSSMTSRHEELEGHTGFEKAAAAHNICTTRQIESPGPMKWIHAIPGKRWLYCPIPKIGSTFWRRVLYMLVDNENETYKQPFDVPKEKALAQMRLFTHPITGSKYGNLLTQSSFSFLFVRDPYSRLLSAFIDKLVTPDPSYWKLLGVEAISKFRPKQNRQPKHVAIDGHDVTFAEFLKYVIYAEKYERKVDGHIISINKRCKPCTYHYSYVGRLESFKDDAFFVMRKLGMKTTVDVIEQTFNGDTLDHEIIDSIRFPFSWRADVVKYISWEKALQRIWLKIQMRGIIESRITLNFTKEDFNKINVNQFIEMARKAHKESNPIELEKQKHLVKMEAFASVPLSDLFEFRHTFRTDFALFGYDQYPSDLFCRREEPQSPTRFFDYWNYN